MEAVGIKPQSTRRNSQLFPDRSSEKKKKEKSYPSDFHRLMRQFNDREESCCGRRELCDPAGRARVPPPPPWCCNAVSVHCAEVERGRGSRRSPLQQQHGEEWSDVGEVGLVLGEGRGGRAVAQGSGRSSPGRPCSVWPEAMQDSHLHAPILSCLRGLTK